MVGGRTGSTCCAAEPDALGGHLAFLRLWAGVAGVSWGVWLGRRLRLPLRLGSALAGWAVGVLVPLGRYGADGRPQDVLGCCECGAWRAVLGVFGSRHAHVWCIGAMGCKRTTTFWKAMRACKCRCTKRSATPCYRGGRGSGCCGRCYIGRTSVGVSLRQPVQFVCVCVAVRQLFFCQRACR